MNILIIHDPTLGNTEKIAQFALGDFVSTEQFVSITME
jgi:hypothetical protein